MRISALALALALLLATVDFDAVDLDEVADVAETARGGLPWGLSSGRESDLPLVMGGRGGRAFTGGLVVVFASPLSFFLAASLFGGSLFGGSFALTGSLFLVAGGGRWAVFEAKAFANRSSAALLKGMLSTEVSGVET
jgi:hypothetical protein